MITQKSNFQQTILPRYKIETKAVSIALFVLLSFVNQIFSHVIGSNSLLIVSLLMTTSFIVLVNFRSSIHYQFFDALWIASLVVVILNSFRTTMNLDFFSINEYVSMFVYFAGVALMLFSGSKSENFNLSLKIILFFSIFYSISVWVQALIPSIYDKFLDLLNISYQKDIRNWESSGLYYTGFSTNPAFTAGHIVNGILLLFSFRKNGFFYRILRIVFLLLLFLFLFVSLLMTGKRAHLLFLTIAITSIYVFPYKGGKLFKKVKNIVICIVLLLVIVILLSEIFADIPTFSRFSSSLNTWLKGGDISSSRNRLYSHAWNQFKLNPLLGNGWGSYRLSTPGAITTTIYQQTHNIYLQLLAEIGILGFIFVMIPIVTILLMTIHAVRDQESVENNIWFSLLNYSLAYQLFFILYGLTGNPMYDVNYLMMYFFSCSISMAYIRYQKPSLTSRKMVLKH